MRIPFGLHSRAFRPAAALVLLLALATILPCAAADAVPFGPFMVSADHARVLKLERELALQFDTGSDWPFVVLRAPDGGLDWSAATTLDIPLRNDSDETVDLFVRLGDDANASWPDHAVSTHALIAAHESTHLLVVFDERMLDAPGMMSPAPPRGVPGAALAVPRTTGRFNAGMLRSVYFVVWGQAGPRQVTMGEPRPLALDWGPANYRGLMDSFGQWRGAEWPDKVHDASELQAVHQRAARGAASEGLARDRFGGSTAGSPLAASGYFRTERDARGRWWLVSPLGNPFFSIGVNAVQIAAGRTTVGARESLFEGLPSTDAPLGRFYGGAGPTRWFDFYGANLWRLFGSAYAERFDEEALGRLSAWGFNTLGSWSDAALQATHRMPYVLTLAMAPTGARVPIARTPATSLPDPFDARFAQDVRQQLLAATAASRDDPWLVGYFVENEIPWGYSVSADPSERHAPASWVLALGPESPAKTAFLAELRARYGEIGVLNAAWGSKFAVWADLARQNVAVDSLSGAAGVDMDRFSEEYASAYYRTISAALKAADPNHLYLGSRLVGRNDAALAACARYCDVISANLYDNSLEARLNEKGGWPDRPILVSEFSFTARDRGLFGVGPIPVASSAARGAAYARYLGEAVEDPRVVGVHWFAYLDEPASGRPADGENANFGIVALTDIPDPDLTQAMTRANLSAALVLQALTSR